MDDEEENTITGTLARRTTWAMSTPIEGNTPFKTPITAKRKGSPLANEEDRNKSRPPQGDQSSLQGPGTRGEEAQIQARREDRDRKCEHEIEKSHPGKRKNKST